MKPILYLLLPAAALLMACSGHTVLIDGTVSSLPTGCKVKSCKRSWKS
ncbi:MAG: hypothetical protein LUB83_04840 [Prevotellaceae bacterium]|nr:hypothetical protein [Prevotellaceae bacterium]